MIRRYLSVTACVVVLSPVALPAQDPWPVTVELYLGTTRGYSDNSARYRGDQTGRLVGIVLGARLHSRDRAGLMIALDGAARMINTTVTTDCPFAPDGGCVPWFPGLGGVSLLAGWESRSTAVRVLAGPGIATSDYDKTLGFVGRVDVAAPVIWHASLVASITSLLVPSWRGDRFHYPAFGVGLRFR